MVRGMLARRAACDCPAEPTELDARLWDALTAAADIEEFAPLRMLLQTRRGCIACSMRDAFA